MDTSLAERGEALVRDIRAALHDDAVASHQPRGDEAHAHVADLGGCDTATAMRRRGYARQPHDDKTLRLFEAGLWYEERKLRAIQRTIPDIVRGVRVAMWPDLGGIGAKIVDEHYTPEWWEMIGHPDGVSAARQAVAEIKSTASYFSPTLQWVYDNKRQWIYQVAAYALALRKPLGVLIFEHRSGMHDEDAVVWLDPRDYEEAILSRMTSVLATTPDNPIPQPHLPEWSFKLNKKTGVRESVSTFCKYCDYLQCALNPRHNNGRVDTIAE